MGIIYSIVSFLLAVYVLTDATKKEISNQLAWAAGTVILWFIVFPLYLIKRKDLEHTVSDVDGHHKPYSNRMGYVLIFVLTLLPYAWNSIN